MPHQGPTGRPPCYPGRMIGIKLDGSRGEKRLKDLLRKVQAWGGWHAEVEPTEVVYELSRMRGQKMLAVVEDGHAREVRRRLEGKAKGILDALTTGKVVSEERIKAFWRYTAYVYVERAAWPSARDGGWGRVLDSTIGRKRREYAQARAFSQAQREVYGQAGRLAVNPHARRGRGGAPPWAIGSYGVRAPEQERRWYLIQIGKRRVGLRDDRVQRTNPVSVKRTSG